MPPPAGKSTVKKFNCVVCFREFNQQSHERQPSNPRKVFKTCSYYLRPEIYTKYSKWDFLSDSERESPFCSLCTSSGQKLSDLNNKLEELQKEIKDFVKYFAKEISRYRSSYNEDSIEDNSVIQEEDSGNSKGRILRNSTTVQSSVSSSSSAYVSQKNITRNSSSLGKGRGSETSPTNIIQKDAKNEMMPINVDQIKEEVVYVDNETEEDEDDENDEGDEDFNITDENDEGASESEQSEDDGTDPNFHASPIPKSKRYSHNNWTEIPPIPDEQLATEWRLLVQAKRQHGETKHFYCKIGGKKCPKRIMIRTFVGTHYYDNGQPHGHYRTEPHGLTEDAKNEIKKILEEEGSAKPTYIIETLKLKGFDLDKKKLTSFLMYERRKILGKVRKGCQKKYKRENGMGDSVDSMDGSGIRKKRGRPKGSLKVIIPPKAFKYGLGVKKHADGEKSTLDDKSEIVSVDLNVNTQNESLKDESVSSNPSNMDSYTESVVTLTPVNTNYDSSAIQMHGYTNNEH